uniref:RasGEF_N_2 domain-containing protein n=1 Tax=Panagrellus redivivus TaxID=6233 RepID=A0A7E4VDV5_PANRE
MCDMTDVDISRDPPASPHNGLSPHHLKEGSSSNGPSSGNRVSFVGGHGIEDNSAEEDDEEPGVFTRADATRDSLFTGGFSRRLSTVIRRSLRLGPKHSLASGNRLSSARFPPQAASSDDKGQPFTEFTDLRKVPCDTPYGTLEELQYYLRLNRMNQEFIVELNEDHSFHAKSKLFLSDFMEKSKWRFFLYSENNELKFKLDKR